MSTDRTKELVILPKSRDYKILFWIHEKSLVYMEISFAKDLHPIVRKHWYGEVSCTAEYFSMYNPNAKPEVKVWDVRGSRLDALNYLREWKMAFQREGFSVIAPQIETERYLKKAKGIDSPLIYTPAQVISGEIVKTVECADAYKHIKSVAQRYTTESADETLCIRSVSSVAESFRDFCRKKGLTQSQGLAVLLDAHNHGTAFEEDVVGRLKKADEANRRQRQCISELKKKVEKERTKDYPKKYMAAKLQDQLLKEFFARLPKPKEGYDEILDILSFKQLKLNFGTYGSYSYPEEDGVILLYLHRLAYGKENWPPIFIYGETEDGSKTVLRWYYRREDYLGRSLRYSPYAKEGAPWLFAVQITEGVADVVGGLPILMPELVPEAEKQKEVWKKFWEFQRMNEEMDKVLRQQEWEFEREMEEMIAKYEDEDDDQIFLAEEDVDSLLADATRRTIK